MSYRATDASTEQSPAERLDEAKRILFEMKLEDEIGRMTPKESEFVVKMADLLRTCVNAYITVKQVWWMRDLKDRYLL